jgi:hypothetical protein
MRFSIADDLGSLVHTRTATPLMFEPEVDWQTFTEPNIIHAY